jgi:hypothetical protein
MAHGKTYAAKQDQCGGRLKLYGKIAAVGGAVPMTILDAVTLVRLKNHGHGAFRRGPAQLALMTPEKDSYFVADQQRIGK